ncbi:hypothetical protein PDJAM_G00237230 [Pangasius djambal]|uniref:Uncharacterized protein n=1 Tax=Pangasius djambal TaxID=1691987 RepID=A0ACC5YI08_9TELE|nr:hypothetical protein [Pangasius djambal]
MSTILLSWSEKVLQLLRRMNSFHLPGSSLEKCLRFEVAGQQVGWIRPGVASVLRRYPEVFCTVGGAIELCPTLDTHERRTQAVEVVLQTLREEAEFRCLKGWRNEFIPKVFSGVEVRALCRTLEFFHSNLHTPCLHGARFVHRGIVMLEQVKELITSEEFKPNCAMVVLDFLIRHSVIEPDSEPYYQEFVVGLHRSL